MVYTIEEKKKMDEIAKVFSQYVAESKQIDLAYTDKTGYMRLIVDEYADNVFFPIQDAEDMLEMFIDDLFSDELHRCGYYERNGGTPDLDRIYADLHTKLSTLKDHACALNYLQSSWQTKVNALNRE